MTTPQAYGLTPEGFIKKPLEVIKSEIEASLQAQLGEINTEPESVIGQIIGAESKPLADLWETIEEVNFSSYPNSAEGKALDDVALIIGVTRIPASRTRVYASVGGAEGTVIPAGSLATQPNSAYTFASVSPVIISRANANYALITVNSYVNAAVYTVTINGIPYSQTAGSDDVTNTEELIEALVEKIGIVSTPTQNYYATDNVSPVNTFNVQAQDKTIPFNINVSSLMSISNIRSPAIFDATQTGPISVPANTLTQTVSSIVGWTTVNNETAGVTGRNIESDAEFRLRRARSFIIAGLATVEAIRSHLLQEVSGVVAVEIIENRTMTQTPLTFSVNTNLLVDDVVSVKLDGVILGMATYLLADTQQTMMQKIADILETGDGVLSATVSATPYRSLTVAFRQGYQITENDLIVNRPATDPFNFSKSGGMPPKSFETIVEGGSDIDVANKIWYTKPAGIETFGNTKVIITDSMGNLQAIFFTRAEPVNIWVHVEAVRNLEEPLAGGSIAAAIQLIKDGIMSYAATLQIGNDVINQRIMCRVIDVSGIGSATVELAAVIGDGTPAYPADYTTGNISIADGQIASFDPANMDISIT